jgi:dTDP-4-dehydrorhamnose reductase
MDKKSEPVLVLGASSWLGYLLTTRLLQMGYPVVGTYFRNPVVIPGNGLMIQSATDKASVEQIVKDHKPLVIVNFLRGEEELDIDFHKYLIQLSERKQLHYIYASSILALDGQKINILSENIEAMGISPYGAFKARCEQCLYESKIDWTILRFASVQGWVPHKRTRNQKLLEELIKSNEIKVDDGVLQNRMLATLLIEGIVDIIKDKVLGIVHFGTMDFSDELDFLKKQARLFKLDDNLIKSSGNARNVNLVAVMGKMWDLYGDKYRNFEKDTLTGLSQIKGLNQLTNPNSARS